MVQEIKEFQETQEIQAIQMIQDAHPGGLLLGLRLVTAAAREVKLVPGAVNFNYLSVAGLGLHAVHL